MRRSIASAVCLALLCGPAQSQETPQAGYMGSQSCRKCHEEIYNRYVDSGHPYKLRRASVAKLTGLPLPKGYAWEDILYVIGGVRKKARFVNLEGFIITTDKKGKPVPTQYNMSTGQWVNYHPGEKKPYKCGPCHMTAYRETGRQHGRIGIVGTWVMDGIQCEECHGPSSLHNADPKKSKLKVDKSSALCGKCHVRGDCDTIPAKAGFIRHHEQYNELLMGGHKKQACVDCHDPHSKVKASIKATCASCHKEEGAAYATEIHGKSGIPCIECHMPRATKSEVALNHFSGDVRTHLASINTDPDYVMFSQDGKLAKAQLSLRFSCLQCHQSRSSKWAGEYAAGFHKKAAK